MRVGGGFVWPPPLAGYSFSSEVSSLGGDSGGDSGVGSVVGKEKRMMKRVVFIAGGVGINPLMSMLSFIVEQLSSDVERKKLGFKVSFLYTSKDVGEENGKGDGEVLFLKRLRDAFVLLGEEGELRVFLTGRKVVEGGGEGGVDRKENMEIYRRRIEEGDLLNALGPVGERADTVIYVCGVPGMTDEFVEKVKGVEGIVKENVLCERWW